MTRYAFPEGVFHIDPMPGQPQIAHCHGFYVFAHMRGKGNGHALKRRQMALLREGKYDFATCTVANNNAAQRSILSQAGWHGMISFRNSNTDEATELWGKAINHKERI